MTEYKPRQYLDGLDEDSPYTPFIINPVDIPVIDIDPVVIDQIIRREEQQRKRDQPQLPLYDFPNSSTEEPKT